MTCTWTRSREWLHKIRPWIKCGFILRILLGNYNLDAPRRMGFVYPIQSWFGGKFLCSPGLPRGVRRRKPYAAHWDFLGRYSRISNGSLPKVWKTRMKPPRMGGIQAQVTAAVVSMMDQKVVGTFSHVVSAVRPKVWRLHRRVIDKMQTLNKESELAQELWHE